MGIKQYFKDKYNWLYQKIVGEDASPEYIARGWAIGMCCGCLIPFGIQLMISIPLAFILKGSKIGATIGTLITNHLTIFVIYPVQCYFGAILIGRPIAYEAIKNALSDVLSKQNWESLLNLGWDLLISFFVGGVILATIMTTITYFFVHSLVKKYKSQKQ